MRLFLTETGCLDGLCGSKVCQCDVTTGAKVCFHLSGGSSGMLYVYYAGEWGLVCDDHFDLNDHGCTALCRSLNYRSVHTKALAKFILQIMYLCVLQYMYPTK